MADDPLALMKQQIAIASGGYALVIIALLAIAFGGPPVLRTLVSLSTGSSSGAVLLGAVTTLALAVGFVIATFDLHITVDHALFHADAAVRTVITDYLQAAVRRTLGKATTATPWDLMGLFYEFANRSDGSWPMLRNVAFYRWTPYHVAMNWLALSIGGAIVVLFSFPYRMASDWYNIGPLAFFATAIVLTFWLSQYRIRPRFVASVALPELVKMTKDQKAQFEEIVRARFATEDS